MAKNKHSHPIGFSGRTLGKMIQAFSPGSAGGTSPKTKKGK